MAKRSSFESLNRRLEDSAEDTNIDVTIIVDADADAAEDILDTQEAGEAAADAEALESEETDAQQEATDAAELAVVLREHGLNAGMAAMLTIAFPLDAYGITMPGKETLDAAGKNQALADRIAASFEAKGDGFWAGTKEFFKKMWEKILSVFRWVANKVSGLRTKVKRAKESLASRTYDSDAAKGEKYATVKGEDTFLDAYPKLVGGVSTLCSKLTSVDFGTVDKASASDIWGSLKESQDAVKAVVGAPFKIEEGVPVGFEDDDKTFLDSDDTNVASGSITEYANAYGKKMLAMVDTYEQLGQLEKKLPKELKFSSKYASIGNDDKEKKDALNKGIGIMRTTMTMVLKIIARANKGAQTVGNTYVKACSTLRKCSKAA